MLQFRRPQSKLFHRSFLRRYSASFIDRIIHITLAISNHVASEGLTEEQKQFQSIAKDFAKNELAPNMSAWDSKKEFPISTLKKAAELGFSGIYVGPDYGGIGVGRLEASVVFEALSQGCVSTAAYLSIHK